MAKQTVVENSRQLAKIMARVGLQMKERSLPDKRIDIFRGPDFLELLQKPAKEIDKLYCEKLDLDDPSSRQAFAQK